MAVLKLDGNAVLFAGPGGEGWRVTISDLRVIGEFLSKHDHYLSFMTKEEWFKAPYGAEGREEAMGELGRRLNHPLRCDLFNATNFSSRVLWPAHLEGQVLFDLLTERRAANIVTRLRQLLLQKVEMRFTAEVRKELGHAGEEK